MSKWTCPSCEAEVYLPEAFNQELVESYFTKCIMTGMAGGVIVGALAMFLICHFRWDLL